MTTPQGSPRVLYSIYELTTAAGHKSVIRSQWELGMIAARDGIPQSQMRALDVHVEDIPDRRRPLTAAERESIAAYTW